MGLGRGVVRAVVVMAALVVLLPVGAVWAGGGAENALVVIDPTNPESLYVGNYYIRARGIPAENVIYMTPDATNYAAFAGFQAPAVIGVTANRRTLEHVDYIVIPPGTNYRISASGLVSDQCVPVRNFSASSVFTMAFIADDIAGGGSRSTRHNQYFSSSDSFFFDSGSKWKNGSPRGGAGSERYFIGGMLGYSGQNGNTLEETLAMIDRAVAVDGTRPDGTFYYMKTTDPLRSGPRDQRFPAAIAAIQSMGGQAEQIEAVLPVGRHDILGIMTGWASPNIDGADMTILPGAMCDHLTSYAGHFGTDSQVKMSRWIAKGANGSYGTVEEPCNYAGKFPHPWFHVHYFAGLTLGEAGLRSLQYVPFQVLAYGDPLTQPWAYLPVVDVPDAPDGPVSGSIDLTAVGVTDRLGARVAGYDVLVNGRTVTTAKARGQFTLDTTQLPDGFNDLRVIGYDDSLVRNQGRWTGALEVNNAGLGVTLSVTPDSGDRSTVFGLDVSASGDAVREVRIMQNGRVIASTASASGSFSVWGETLGAGGSTLTVEADFAGGGSARSEAVDVDVAFANPPSQGADTVGPVAYGYTRDVSLNRAMIIELPAFDPDDPEPSRSIVSGPGQATIEGSGPYRLIKPDTRATGTDTVTFTASSDGQTSAEAAITLVYGVRVPCDAIKKFKGKCRNGKVKVTVKLTNLDHDGDVLTVSVDDRLYDVTVSDRKAKLVLTDQSAGEHAVSLEYPPGCADPMTVTCP